MKINLNNLNSIKGNLLNSNNLYRDLNLIRRKVDSQFIPNIVSFVASATKLHKYFYHSAFPLSVEYLTMRNPLSQVDLARELLWATSYVKVFSKQINEFIHLSNNYNQNLLLGNLDACEILLDEIESKFGQSFWLIKNKIAFLQLTKGLEAQKKYSSSIKIKSSENSLVYFFAHYISYRNEPTISYFLHRSEVKEILEDKIVDKFISPFIKYQFAAHDILNSSELSDLLRLSGVISVIDCFDAVQYSIRSIISADISDLKLDFSLSDKSLAKDIVRSLLESIDSPLLVNMNNDLLKEGIKANEAPIFYDSQIAYMYGQEDLAINFAEAEIFEDVNNFSSLATIARIISSKDDFNSIDIKIPKKV